MKTPTYLIHETAEGKFRIVRKTPIPAIVGDAPTREDAEAAIARYIAQHAA